MHKMYDMINTWDVCTKANIQVSDKLLDFDLGSGSSGSMLFIFFCRLF